MVREWEVLMKKTQLILLVIVIFAMLVACGKETLPEVPESVLEPLKLHLEDNEMSPSDYILSQYEDKDIVFLGEYHRITHDLELVHELIPKLYEAGVYTLGIEFACASDQEKIDSLLNSDVYDQELANEILYNWGVYWGYEEYLDIYKITWELNQTLEADQKKFRIVGLDAKEDYSYFQTDEDWDNQELKAKAYAEGNRDIVMARTVMSEIVDKDEKALIYSGINHAITKFKQPFYDKETNEVIRFNNERMGNIIYDAIGERCMTIFLHSPWYGLDYEMVYPVDGVIDVLMKTHQQYPIGFDVVDSPFGNLIADTSEWATAYEDFKLSDYCDGYIFTKPISEYEGVSYQEGFINSENLADATLNFPNTEIKQRKMSIATFKRLANSDANIKKRFKKFE